MYIWCETEILFGVRTRYFFFHIWCEFETFSFVPILELNCNVFAPCSEFWCESVTNTSHFWCENVTNLVSDRYNNKWFGAKTRLFFVRKRDILLFRTWCQNVKTWCEFETYAFSYASFR